MSRNNGANASLQTVIKVPTNKGPTNTNNDVSLNDLSANTMYDLSINIIGYYRDLSNAEFDISGTTRPSDFVANDMSQNETDNSSPGRTNNSTYDELREGAPFASREGKAVRIRNAY